MWARQLPQVLASRGIGYPFDVLLGEIVWVGGGFAMIIAGVVLAVVVVIRRASREEGSVE